MRRFKHLPLFALLGLSLSAEALELPQQLPIWQPEPGLQASVGQSGGRYLLLQPDGSQSDLSASGQPRFALEDYDFDGHTDLAIGNADGMYQVYRYRPGARRYEPLSLPEPLLEQLSCQHVSKLERSVEERALYRRCSGGLHRFYDAFRFDAQGQPWLYKTLVLTDEDASDYPYLSFPLFEITLDAEGEEVASRALVDGDRTLTWTVPTARLYLYAQPDEDSRSNAYLIRGDVCEVLAQQAHWLLIRYQSRKGPLERWVSLQQAYDLHQRYDPTAAAQGVRLEGGLNAEDLLFTLGIASEQPLNLAHAEVHLLLTGEDGSRYSQRLYLIDHPLQVRAGGRRTLDDNYVRLQDGEWRLDGAKANVPFFPAQLQPGRYRLRVALTDPALPEPLFSAEESLLDYPPQSGTE